MDRNCKCGEKLKPKQKKYCSVECQYKSYKVQKTPRIITNCLFCDKEIETTEYKLSIGKSKYCSKQCNNEHKKETYKGENNGMWGVKYSNEKRKEISNRTKKLWENKVFREKYRLGIMEFVNKNGYWPGTDEESLKKKEETCMKKYGVRHAGWNVPHLRDKLENTCLERYGKHSWQLGQDKQKLTDTDIEVVVEDILSSNNIEYIKQYRIYYDGMKYKKYDFYLPDIKTIIECDGDYWHANPSKYPNPNKNQINNILNDKFKTNLVNENGYNLLRFWGSDILTDDFSVLLLSHIQ